MATKQKKSVFDEAINFVKGNIVQPIQKFAQPIANNIFKGGQNLVRDYQNFQQQQDLQRQRNQQQVARFAQDFAKQTGNFANKNVFTPVKSFFEFDPNKDANPYQAGPQNFWRTPVAAGLNDIQKRFQTGQLINPIKRDERFDAVPLYKPASQVQNFIQNIPGALVNSIYGSLTRVGSDWGQIGRNYFTEGRDTQYNELFSPITKAGYQLGGAIDPRRAAELGINMRPQEFLGNVGGIVTPIADAYLGAGLPATFLRQLEARAAGRFLPTVIKSGVENFVPGLISGFSSGLDQGRGASNVDEQLQNAAILSLQSGALSFGGGALLSGLGIGFRKAFARAPAESRLILQNRDLVKKNVLGVATAEEQVAFRELNKDGKVDAFLQDAFPEYYNEDGTIKPEFFDPQTTPLNQLDEANYRVQEMYHPNTTKYNKQMAARDMADGQRALIRVRDAIQTNDLNAMVSDDFFRSQKLLRELASDYLDKKFAKDAPIEDIINAIEERIDYDSGKTSDQIHPGLMNDMTPRTDLDVKKIEKDTPMGPEAEFEIKNLGEFRTAPGGEFDLSKMEGAQALKSMFSDEEIDFMTQGANDIVTPDGKVARGKYYNGLVEVVEKQGQVSSQDVYHEAFHAYTDKFVDKNLYDSAVKEAIALGAKDAKEAEEFLAEGFADWMKGKQDFPGQVMQFFSYLFEQIKAMVGRENSVNLLYGDIMARRRPQGIPVGRSGFGGQSFRVQPDNAVPVAQPAREVPPADILQMIDDATKVDENAGRALYESFAQEYDLPPFEQMQTASAVGLSSADLQPHADEIAQYEQEMLAEMQKEVSENHFAKTPEVAQYASTIRKAVKTYNLLKNKKDFDLDSLGQRIAKSGGAGLDEAIEAIRNAGGKIDTVEDLLAVARELPKKGRVPVGQKTTRAYFSDIPRSALVDALNNPNSTLRKAIRNQINERVKAGEFSGGAPKGEKLRSFVKTVRESLLTEPEVAAKTGGTYQQVGIDPTMKAAQDYVQTNEAEVYQKVFSEKETYDADWTTKGMALAEKLQNEGKYQDAANVLNEIAKRSQVSGQANAMLKWWARMSPTGMLKYAIQEVEKARENLGVVGKFIKKEDVRLTDEDMGFITERMKEINQMAEGAEKDAAVLEVLDRINQRIPIRASEAFEAYRYQNLLSNPRSQERNIFSNIWQTLITKPATLGTEGAIDFVQSALKPGRERTAYMKDVPVYYKNMINAFPTAIHAFMEGWAGQPNMKNPDLSYVRNRKLPKVLTIATRLLDGEDRFFGALISAGQYAVEKSHGIADDVAKARAEQAAAYSLFRAMLDPKNKTGQGALLSKIDTVSQTLQKLGHDVPGLRWFIPFIRTPMNVAKAQLEYSPLGLMTLKGSTHKREQVAKAMLGSIFTGLGASYALQGKTTWAVPSDPKEKEYFYASGKKPFSINIGGQWVPITYFGPFALALAVPAAAKHYQDESKTALTDEWYEKVGKVAMGIANFYSQATYLSGIGGFVRTAQGDIDFNVAKNLGFTAGQAIPVNGFLGYISKIIDPTYRRPQGFVQSATQNIPGVSFGFEAVKDPLGNEVKRTGDTNFPLSDYILPYTIGSEVPEYDQLLQEKRTELQNNAVLSDMQKAIEKELGDIEMNGVAGASTVAELEGIEGKNQVERLRKKANEYMDLYFKTNNPAFKQQIQGQLEKLGVSFEDAMEGYVNKDIKVKKKGLSPEVEAKLERSNEFEYVRKLRDQYGDLLTDDTFLENEMARKGISYDALEYDDATLLDDDVQLDEVLSRTQGLEGEQLMTQLIRMREVSEGSRKMLLTDNLIGKLKKRGIISPDDADFLETIEWDDEAKEFKKMPGTDSGSGKKPKAVNVSNLSGAVREKKVNPIQIGGSKDNFEPLKPIKVTRAQISRPPKAQFKSTYQPRQIRYNRPRTPVLNITGLGGRS